jgi:hypothetical protein
LLLFDSYEYQETQIKSSFDPILDLCFNLKHLKMNAHCIKMKQFCKGLSKGLIFFKKLMEKRDENNVPATLKKAINKKKKI